MPTVTFVDETLAGARSDGWELKIFEERLRLDELTRRRIHQEVAEHDARPAGDSSAPHGVEWEVQCERALEAFQRNGFVVLVGDRQGTALDREAELSARTEVTFLKLVPVVGGR